MHALSRQVGHWLLTADVVLLRVEHLLQVADLVE